MTASKRADLPGLSTSRQKPKLLNRVAGAEVAGIERLAAGETFVLAMVKTDAVLAELPAEIHILLIDDGGKIKEAHGGVLVEGGSLPGGGGGGPWKFGKLGGVH